MRCVQVLFKPFFNFYFFIFRIWMHGTWFLKPNVCTCADLLHNNLFYNNNQKNLQEIPVLDLFRLHVNYAVVQKEKDKGLSPVQIEEHLKIKCIINSLEISKWNIMQSRRRRFGKTVIKSCDCSFFLPSFVG